MGGIVFLKIETLKVNRAVAKDPPSSSVDTEMTDSFFVNLFKKYVAPIDSGGDQGAITGNPDVEPLGAFDYSEDVTDSDGGWTQQFNDQYVAGKPVMLTVEGDHIIGYTLDYLINETSFVAKNPVVNNNGNDRIKKIDGGDVNLDSSGLNWEVLVEDGVVVDEDGNNILVPAAVVTAPTQTFPVPFMLYNRADIS